MNPMKQETILEYVLSRLNSTKGRLREIAHESGVPYSSVAKIAHRVTPNPGINNVQALHDYFRAEDARKNRKAA